MKSSLLLFLLALFASSITLAAIAGDSTTYTIHVKANQSWTRSGIKIHEGQTITFGASGKIDAKPGDPNSYYHDVTTIGRSPSPQFPYPKLRGMCLLARLGQMAPFEVGYQREL